MVYCIDACVVQQTMDAEIDMQAGDLLGSCWPMKGLGHYVQDASIAAEYGGGERRVLFTGRISQRP